MPLDEQATASKFHTTDSDRILETLAPIPLKCILPGNQQRWKRIPGHRFEEISRHPSTTRLLGARTNRPPTIPTP